MKLEEFIQQVQDLFDQVEGRDNPGAALILIAGNGEKGIHVIGGSYVAVRAILSAGIDHRNKGNEDLYGIVRDCFGAELMERVKAGVATGVKSIANKNIKDGKFLHVKPPKEKS